MNLEIDISDPRQLSKIRAELTRLLSIVDFAISQHNSAHGKALEGQSTLLHPIDNGAENGSRTHPVDAAIEAVPLRFTTSDVIVALGNEGKASRSAVKLALKKLADAGEIRIVKPGQGRRPTEYEKKPA